MRKEVRPKAPEAAQENSTDSSSTVQPMQVSPMLAEQSIKHNFSANKTNPEQFIQTKPKENTSDRKADEKSNSLGEVAWERIFHESELPHTDFMGQLKKVITREQFQQLNNDILKEMESNK